MQVFLFQEREQVLKLYAENDRLKVGLTNYTNNFCYRKEKNFQNIFQKDSRASRQEKN